jgi:RNase P/RNase MRP subunit p29
MRKSLLFCVAAVLSLALAGPVSAQSDQPQAPATTSGTTATTTVTGTVVSSTSNELVIDTATGRQRFVVESGTSDIPANLAAGTQVRVEFRTLDGDRRQVARVTASLRTGASSTSSSTSSSSLDRDADATTDLDRDPRAGAADPDPDDDALPATASPVGLIGLLGLLSLGSAAAVRAWRRLF